MVNHVSLYKCYGLDKIGVDKIDKNHKNDKKGKNDKYTYFQEFNYP